MRQYLKIIVAAIVIIAALYWAVDSARTRTYSGTNLSFVVGQGAVTVKNAQDMPVVVQLTSPGTRTFTVKSPIAGAAGTSAKQVNGTTTQLYEITLPAGESQFTVTGTTVVSFGTTATTRLDASVQPLTESDARTTLIVAVVVILGALYYISKTTGHRWIGMVRGRLGMAQPVTLPVATAVVGGQGPEIRAYGDNRSDRTKS